MEETTSPVLQLPGFRFHPTEEELLDFYLRNILHGKKFRYDVIRFLNIYHHDPSELPDLAGPGEREWYFFVPRDRKQGSGGRPNRTTEHGFWKATGSDRKIVSLSNHKRVIGMRKTLVFYKGRAPRGNKTDWIMNEYRLPDNSSSPKDMVLCKIYKKATPLKVLERRAALEEAIKTSKQSSSSSSPLLSSSSPPPVSPIDTMSFDTCPDEGTLLLTSGDNKAVLKQEDEEELGGGNAGSTSSKLRLPFERETLPELQVPRMAVVDWTQDNFWTQFNSPWLPNLMATPYASTLNFLSN